MCGAAIRDINAPMEDESAEDCWPIWRHVPGSDTACTKVHRAADVQPDRALITAAAEQMAQLGERTRRAAGEFEHYTSMMAELLDESRELKAALNQPRTIERATLNKVWDRLVDAGNMSGAATVGQMLRDLG